MMLPVEVTETTVTNDGTEEIRRRKRSVGQSHEVLFEVRVIYCSFSNIVILSYLVYT